MQITTKSVPRILIETTTFFLVTTMSKMNNALILSVGANRPPINNFSIQCKFWYSRKCENVRDYVTYIL